MPLATQTQIERLIRRLEHARHANRQWPSMKNQDQICLIEQQIRKIRKGVALSTV